MKLDDNTNYFIECGNDVEKVVQFVVEHGGYRDWDIDELEERLLEIKGEYFEIGGILLTCDGGLLWSDTISMHDGHLERHFQPLVRIKLNVVRKRIPKLTV
jgi:hypothetical protein